MGAACEVGRTGIMSVALIKNQISDLFVLGTGLQRSLNNFPATLDAQNSKFELVGGWVGSRQSASLLIFLPWSVGWNSSAPPQHPRMLARLDGSQCAHPVRVYFVYICMEDYCDAWIAHTATRHKPNVIYCIHNYTGKLLFRSYS